MAATRINKGVCHFEEIFHHLKNKKTKELG